MRLFGIKKTVSLLLAGLLTSGACACSAAGINDGSGRLKVVTTIFPGYDWVKEIAGDRLENIDLTLLLDNGVDMHSFQPTAQDIIRISSCDVFVYVGGESDEWVGDALKEAVNKDMQAVNLMELLGDGVVEEIVEGMQGEDGAADGADTGNAGNVPEETEYDEHIWLSPLNAQILVTGIADAMAAADPANASAYKDNAAAYNTKLADLDGRYREAAENAKRDTVIFGDRFPFRYLIDECGLNYYAAFSGCSAETEASFETVVFLSGKIDELDIRTILVIEGSDQKVAQTLISNTASKDQEILVMDSMQSTTSSDSAKGVTYMSVMEKNLEVLTRALG